MALIDSVKSVRLPGLSGRRPVPEHDSAIAAAALRSDRFRQAREADWQRLERIVARLEAGRLRSLSDEDLLALPALYRTAASSLSIARETSLDKALSLAGRLTVTVTVSVASLVAFLAVRR